MNHSAATLHDLIRERILMLDGAMGTMIQTYQLDEADFRATLFKDHPGQLRGNNDVLCLTRPDVVTDIHRRYLAAGADLIETNTFSAQRISQADYGLADRARDMALAGARLARQAADEFAQDGRPRFVCGSVGPTNKTCSMSPDVSDPAFRDVTFDELRNAYREQIDALAEGGVDALLIETIFDTLNAKAAIMAATEVAEERGIRLPLMLSVTVADLSGRTLSGQTLGAFLASISTFDVFSVGLNCSFGAAQMKPFLRELSRRAPYYISVYPNAGLPDALGQYDETPESMAPQVAELVDEGLVNILGGCCGTTDAFIRAFAPIVRAGKRHEPVPAPAALWLSGIDMLELKGAEAAFSPSEPASSPLYRNMTIVGERCNVAGSRKFLRLIKEKNYDEAVVIARRQVEDGAQVIDINMDDGLLDARHEMVHFLNLIASEPDVARVPVMIDSSDWQVILAALKCCQGKSIVNSLSLKEGEAVFLQRARDVKRYGAACVVMCFDELGQATTYERRIEIAARAYDLLTRQVGMNPYDIIFDPNILAIATGMEEHDSYAVDFIRATRWIRTHLPGAHVSGGVSNLSFSFRGNTYVREAMHAVFLYHAIQAGMDFGIVNPASKVSYGDIPSDQLRVIEDVVLNRRSGAADELIELGAAMGKAASATSGPAVADGQAAERTAPLEERLAEALRRGIADHLADDLGEALRCYPSAVDIIEGPLMAGMNTVGQLFGEGKMFLPQVVKTARTMKQAVAFLQPYIEQQQKQASAKAGKIILATVKGDVHDIGKNIVSVVMACNNYEVIDLGVMVPAETIVETAIREQADAVGLSGLITPSLEEMVVVAKAMQEAGLHIPIMIGGATTSQMHVALKIAPVYSGPVVWMKDAAQNVVATARLLNPREGERYAQQLLTTYDALRASYHTEQQRLLDLEEARKNKLKLFD